MVDAQDGNSFNMKQFLEYRDFREQNHALKDQFHIDETVEFGFFSEKFVFDYQNNLFCMDKGLDRTIFHGSELESFLISEDGAPLLEGSARGYIRHQSTVPQRINDLLPQMNQLLLQQQMQETLERITNRENDTPTATTRIDLPEPFKKFYIKLYFRHPYWKLREFDRTGPTLIGDVPDLNQYRIEYNEDVEQLKRLADALARVAGFPLQGSTAPSAPAAAAPAPAPAVDAVAEIKKYKELLDAGVITEAEFAAKKKQLMGI